MDKYNKVIRENDDTFYRHKHNISCMIQVDWSLLNFARMCLTPGELYGLLAKTKFHLLSSLSCFLVNNLLIFVLKINYVYFFACCFSSVFSSFVFLFSFPFNTRNDFFIIKYNAIFFCDFIFTFFDGECELYLSVHHRMKFIGLWNLRSMQLWHARLSFIHLNPFLMNIIFLMSLLLTR